jgi:hypothetical protein
MKQKDIKKRLSIMENIEMIPSKYLVYSQIWLNSFVNCHHILKLKKKAHELSTWYIGFFMKKNCPNSLHLEEKKSKLPDFHTL